MADFGTCATSWPLMDEWDEELLEGKDAYLKSQIQSQTGGQLSWLLAVIIFIGCSEYSLNMVCVRKPMGT